MIHPFKFEQWSQRNQAQSSQFLSIILFLYLKSNDVRELFYIEIPIIYREFMSQQALLLYTTFHQFLICS